MPKIHPNGLIFPFTPITIKPHTVKVTWKVALLFYKFVGKIDLNMQMSLTLCLIDLWPRSHKVTSKENRGQITNTFMSIQPFNLCINRINLKSFATLTWVTCRKNTYIDIKNWLHYLASSCFLFLFFLNCKQALSSSLFPSWHTSGLGVLVSEHMVQHSD